MATSTGKFPGYNITELEYIVLFELGQVTGTTASYARFPRWYLRQKFNERQTTLVRASKCLRKLCLVPAQDGRRTYKLPDICMDGGVLSAKYYTSEDDYNDLHIVDTSWLDEHRQGWRTEDEADPEYVVMAPNYGNVQTFSLYPVPDTDGTSYADDVETGIYLGSYMPGTGTNYSGACSDLGSTTTLTDTNSTFTAEGIVPGMVARNITDGSYGKITTVNATSLVTATLTGGTDNTWQSADAYVVLSGEYMVICDYKNLDRYLFASEIGMLDSITIPADNILIEFIPFPIAFPFDAAETDANQGYLTMYPEVPKQYHHGLAMGVVADILRTFNEGSKEFQRAEAYENAFKAAAGQAVTQKESRPFDDTNVRMVPKMRRRRR
jgi:hypothetical protein